MLLKKKLRPTTSVINNKNRPLRPYQKQAVLDLEEKRKLQHQTSKIAVLYLDSDPGTGKDDMMKYFGEYTGLPGGIMLLAPEIAMIEKVEEKWIRVFDPAFTSPRRTLTSTIQSLYSLAKKINAGLKLNKKQKELFDNLKECSTLCFNEVHKLSSGNDVIMIPTIVKALEKLDLPFTCVNVSAVIEEINKDAWGVPFEIGLVQTKDTDKWLNPTKVHTHVCGMKGTWKQVAIEIGFTELEIEKLDDDVKQAMSSAYGTVAEKFIYADSDTAEQDMADKKALNEKLAKMHPGLQGGIFTEQSEHLLKLATIDDIMDVYLANENKDEDCIWYTYNDAIVNGGRFSYTDYLVDRLNTKIGKKTAVAYNSEMDKQECKMIREDFEKNRGNYRHIVCKHMLVEDFDKLDLLNEVNAHPVRDPRSARRKQKYGRVRRPILTNPLDHTTNIKKTSNIYQATNIKHINVAGKKFKKDTIDVEVLKKLFPDVNLEDPETLALYEGLVANAAETKIAIADKEDDPFAKVPIELETQQTNELDDILSEDAWEQDTEQLEKDTHLAPGVTVNLHKITDVQAGHSISLGSKSYSDMFKVTRYTEEQYLKWVKNKLVIL